MGGAGLEADKIDCDLIMLKLVMDTWGYPFSPNLFDRHIVLNKVFKLFHLGNADTS